MATINLTQLKKEKEASKKASSFNNAPTIVLNKGKSSVETSRTNYDFSDRTAEPVQRKTLQTPVVAAPQTQQIINLTQVDSNKIANAVADARAQMFASKLKGTTKPESQNSMLDSTKTNAGYIGEKALKGAPGAAASLGYLGGTLVDNAGSTLDYIYDKVGEKNDAVKLINTLADLTDVATKGKITQLRKSLDESELLNQTAGAIKDKSKDVMDWSKESSYDPEEISTGVQLAGDVVGGISQMVPSIAATVATKNPTVGKVMMSGTAAGNALDEALKDGASYEDALTHAIATGTVEYVLESLGGSLPFLGEGKLATLAKGFVEKNLQGPIGKQIFGLAADALGEGFEEYLSEVIGEYLTDIYTDAKKEDDIITRFMNVQDEALYSALIGGLTGAVMNVPRTVRGLSDNTSQPAEVQKTPTEKDPMKAMINEDAKTEAQKIVADMGQSAPVNDYVAEGLKSDNVAVKMEAQKKNAENIRKSAKKLNIDKQVEEIIQVSNKLGKTIEFTEDLVDQKAWGANTGEKIILSKKSGDMIQQIFVHELTHDAENSQLYSELETELSNLAAVNGVDVTALTEQIIRDYAEQGVSLDDVGARAEVNARIAQEYLFKESGIKQLANTNLSLAQKVFNWVRSLRIKLSGTEAEKQLLKTEQLYKKAINEVTKNTLTKTNYAINVADNKSNQNVLDQNYTEEERLRIARNENHHFLSDMSASEFFSKFKNSSQEHRLYLGKLNNTLVDKLFNDLGIDYSGYSLSLSSSGYTHTNNVHGVDGRRSRSDVMPIDGNVINNLANILQNYDSVEMRKVGNQVRLVFDTDTNKNFGYRTIELVPKRGKELTLYNIYAYEKNGTNRVPNTANAAPSLTATDSAGSLDVPNQSISDSSENNNTQYSISSDITLKDGLSILRDIKGKDISLEDKAFEINDYLYDNKDRMDEKTYNVFEKRMEMYAAGFDNQDEFRNAKNISANYLSFKELEEMLKEHEELKRIARLEANKKRERTSDELNKQNFYIKKINEERVKAFEMADGIDGISEVPSRPITNEQKLMVNRLESIRYKYSNGDIYVYASDRIGNIVDTGYFTPELLANKFGTEIANKIINNLSPLEKTMRDFKKYDDAISEEVINETTKLAKKKFGVTSNPYEAGYMTLDGKWLDFSDKKNGAPAGTRNNDHIEARFSNGVEMNDFIKMGNIRLQPESSGFQILKEPTTAQQKSLSKYLSSLAKPKDGYFIGFADPNSPARNADYLVFEPNTSAKEIMAKVMSNFKEDKQYSVGGSILERAKDPAVRARAQMEKRIRHTFLFNSKSNPLKMYDVTSRIEDEFERTGKISDDLRKELFTTAYEETLRSSDVSYKELPEFKQMLQEDLNRAVSQYENTLIKERELKKFAEENDIDVSEVRLNPTTGFLKNVKPQDLPDKIISYKKLKASLKSDLINQVDNYAGGKVIDELIDKAAIEIVEDGFISSPTKFEIRQEMIKNGYSINTEAMNDNKELYDFIKSTKFNVPRGFGREIQDFDRTKKLLKTSTQDGQSIDTVYKELRSRFGEFFPDDLTNPADQYQQIADVMAELEPTRLMLEDSEQYNAEMRQYLEDNFTDRLEDFKNQVLYRSQKDYYDRAAKKQVAYDEAMNQISDKISEKYFKENSDVDKLKRSEDVIKGASIEALSEVVAKIKDWGNPAKTLSQNLDVMANGDVMLRAKLSEIFEKPLREAKKTYVTNQKRVLNDMYKRIVTDLGIKMGSKESAAMMWYGEGRRQLNKVKGKVESDKLEFTPYTLDDLKKDFPNTWQNIVEADKIMRKYYDEYVDRINESLEKVYSESVLKESVNEKRTQLQKDIREAQERLEELKGQRTGEVGGPDLEARINAQRKRITDLSRQFNNVAEDVYRNKRLKKRSDYYHHFQEVGFAENIQQILNVDSANNISNALAGISEFTKPKSKWEKFMQRRSNTARYEEDAIKGFLKYAPAAEYKISFDPYVAQLRGTIQDMIKLSDEANLNNAMSILWLTNYTNSLAGKTNPFDRWIVNIPKGRDFLRGLIALNSRVKGNAVMGNLNSVVSQFYNLPNGLAVLTDNGGAQASLDVAKGSADYFTYAAKKLARQDVSDSPINQSVFLAERYIDSTIDQFDERIIHKPAQAATFLLTFGDQVVAEQLWFSAYNQAQRLGKNDPIAYADDLVSRSVAGRGIGEVPIVQQSQFVKLIAPFQVEVNNAWQLMKQMGGSALKDKDKALGLLVMYGMTWIMNEINEALTGNRVGMDIFNAIEDAVKNWDSEKNIVANASSAAGRVEGEILSNIPMGAQLAQIFVSDEYGREKLFGESDPSRYGTGNIGINSISDPINQLRTGQNVDWQSFITNFVTPYGGKQLNRFYKMAEDIGLIPRVDFNMNDGLQASWKPGAYNDKGQLKYQIDTSDPLNVMKGFAFGTYATNEGKNYLDNEYSALSAKKTTLYENAVEAGADPVEFYNALREANYSRNLVDKNGESIDNSKAAMNREALERNNSFDEVKKLIESGQAEASDFGLNKAVFEWTQEEFNKFMKSLNK